MPFTEPVSEPQNALRNVTIIYTTEIPEIGTVVGVSEASFWVTIPWEWVSNHTKEEIEDAADALHQTFVDAINGLSGFEVFGAKQYSTHQDISATEEP